MCNVNFKNEASGNKIKQISLVIFEEEGRHSNHEVFKIHHLLACTEKTSED